MGLFDNLGGSLGGMLGAAAPGLISAALAKTNLGDMQGIVNQLEQNGLGAQVQSWLGNGTAVLRAMPNMPAAVDQASPNGTVEAQ